MKNAAKPDRKLITTIVVVAVAFILFRLASLFKSHFNMGTIPLMLTIEAFFCICTIIGAVITHRLNTLLPRKRGFGMGLLTGMIYIVMGLFQMLVAIGRDREITVAGNEVLMFLGYVLLVGITEELLFRGILLNGFLDFWGKDSPASIRKAVIVSGCIFGALHFLNIFSGVSVMSAAVQAIGNMLSGALWGAMYIRSRKNLWPVILIHAFYDFAGFFASGVLSGEAPTAATNYSWVNLLLPVIELLIALFLMRKKKLLALIEDGSLEK